MATPNGRAVCADNDVETRLLLIQLNKTRVCIRFSGYPCFGGTEVDSGRLQISIPVKAIGSEWIAAEVLRDEFLHAQDVEDAVETTAELENETEATIEFFARFLAFAADNIKAQEKCASSRTAVLVSAFRTFTNTYTEKRDIHSLVATFDTDSRKTVLTSYYKALASLESLNVSDIPRGPRSALLTAAANGEASIYALFGGQGTNEVYFDELQSLYDIYKPYVAPFIAALTVNVLQPLATATSMPFYTYGLDVISWLSGALPRPSTQYFASVPVSFPLIGLTQLTQYLIVCRVTDITPGEMRRLVHGATGHSQGIVSAVAIAASHNLESFERNAARALKWLFFCGGRGQEAFPVLSLEPSIVNDAVEGGEGAPSPMLSVSGLPLKELQPHIEKTNKYLPENSQLYVSLYNGPKTFVVTGPGKALYGLVTSLRKIRAPSGLDQSKTPFSQRKPVFNMRFLVVSVPYHSDYLKDVSEKVIKDLQDEELWTPADLAIPVFHTEDGTLHLTEKVS